MYSSPILCAAASPPAPTGEIMKVMHIPSVCTVLISTKCADQTNICWDATESEDEDETESSKECGCCF